MSCLVKMRYKVKEWHLSPLQFGIPNERPRYYLTAELSLNFLETDWEQPRIIKEFSNLYTQKSLQDFLDGADSVAIDLPVSLLKARKFISKSEISKATDIRSKCFTKAYGHHGLHSGCFLMTKQVKSDDIDIILEDPVQASQLLGLRMFSPKEISRLHMFPKTFQFPAHISLQQQWKLLGNSMNILVVSELLADLFNCNLL